MKLVLSTEHVRNTIMTNPEGQVIFKTDTPFNLTSPTTTIWKIRPNAAEHDMRDEFDVMAEIEWHPFTSSKFRFGGSEVETKQFIQASGWARRTRKFQGSDRRSYKWTLGHRAPSLELDDGSKTPVARFHRRSLGIIGAKHPPYLEIFPAGEQLVDEIILTFVYVEKLRKDKERAVKHSGGAGGGP